MIKDPALNVVTVDGSKFQTSLVSLASPRSSNDGNFVQSPTMSARKMSPSQEQHLMQLKNKRALRRD